MLVGADEIGGARRRVEALREHAVFIEKILADHGQCDPIWDVQRAAIRAVAVLDVNEFNFTAQVFHQMGRRTVLARKRASGNDAPSFAAPANGASSGVESGVS
jgi:hypothetical protein